MDEISQRWKQVTRERSILIFAPLTSRPVLVFSDRAVARPEIAISSGGLKKTQPPSRGGECDLLIGTVAAREHRDSARVAAGEKVRREIFSIKNRRPAAYCPPSGAGRGRGEARRGRGDTFNYCGVVTHGPLRYKTPARKIPTAAASESLPRHDEPARPRRASEESAEIRWEARAWRCLVALCAWLCVCCCCCRCVGASQFLIRLENRERKTGDESLRGRLVSPINFNRLQFRRSLIVSRRVKSWWVVSRPLVSLSASRADCKLRISAWYRPESWRLDSALIPQVPRSLFNLFGKSTLLR